MIIGNAGNNAITGGLGRDTLTGNAGADTFLFRSIQDSGNSQSLTDRITDFSAAQGDRINVSGIDAISSTVADDAFTFIGVSAFSAAGSARSFEVSGVTYVALNTDANLATVETMVSLTGAIVLGQGDFVL